MTLIQTLACPNRLNQLQFVEDSKYVKRIKLVLINDSAFLELYGSKFISTNGPNKYNVKLYMQLHSCDGKFDIYPEKIVVHFREKKMNQVNRKVYSDPDGRDIIYINTVYSFDLHKPISVIDNSVDSLKYQLTIDLNQFISLNECCLEIDKIYVADIELMK